MNEMLAEILFTNINNFYFYFLIQFYYYYLLHINFEAYYDAYFILQRNKIYKIMQENKKY